MQGVRIAHGHEEDSFSHATQQGQFLNYLEPDISTQKAAYHPLPHAARCQSTAPPEQCPIMPVQTKAHSFRSILWQLFVPAELRLVAPVVWKWSGMGGLVKGAADGKRKEDAASNSGTTALIGTEEANDALARNCTSHFQSTDSFNIVTLWRIHSNLLQRTNPASSSLPTSALLKSCS